MYRKTVRECNLSVRAAEWNQEKNKKQKTEKKITAEEQVKCGI